MPEDFLHKHVPALGRGLHRVGLSAGFGLTEVGVHAAIAAGLQYVFWNPRARLLTKVLQNMPSSQRQRLVLATGPTFGFFPGSVRRHVERCLKVLKTERLDVLQLYWLGKMSAWRAGVVDEMVRLKDEGKVGALGVSIHDRVRAGALAKDSPLDVLMIRYNAAHPGAERDIFPHVATRGPAVVAYTATAWRRLLKPPSGWNGPVPTAGDCYRFCLSHPAVDIVLMGPKDEDQLQNNLTAIERGPLSGAELAFMREFGAAVHG
ncbi:MAG: aldo/keto reductase [Deltaproteobacteria bacterium]|nr:aldo/keto reductase [Deltaproteobacteria bacterium]